LVAGAYGQASTGETLYQQALQLNKQGEYQRSATLLRALMVAHPEIERYKSDYLAVASSAQQCTEVLKFASRSYVLGAAIYVQDAIFSCAVATQKFEDIEALAKVILSVRNKDRAIVDRVINLAMARKNESAALSWSMRYTNDYPEDLNAWLLRAQVLQNFNQRYSALLIYENLYQKHPNNLVVQRKVLEVLLDLGIPHLALSRIEKFNFSYADIQKLRAMANAGAVNIRWSNADPATGAQRRRSLERAIAELKQAQVFAQSVAGEHVFTEQIQNDLIVAYERRRDWPRAIELYEELKGQGTRVRDYARLSAAIAYGASYRIIEAGALLADLYQRDPSAAEVAFEYYFNLVDQDRYPEAKDVIDRLVLQFKKRSATSEPSDLNYTQLLVNQAYLDAYQDRHADAFKKLEPLFEKAPASTDLLIAAGTISEWQGKPRAAEEYFRIASNQDPSNIEAKLGVANAQMSQGDLKPMRETLADVQSDYGDLFSVRKAAARLDRLNQPYVTGTFVLGNGDYGVQKNNNWTADLRGYSELYHDHYRAFVRYRGLNSGPAIPANVQGFGAGVQYTGKNRDAELELGDLSYARVQFNQSFDDHWSVGLSYEKNAFYLLPGSLYVTYAGNVSGVNVRWKNGDTTDAFMGYRYWVLTDNIKQEVFGAISQNIVTKYNFKLDVSGWIGNQQNTNPNVGYFAPANQTEYSGNISMKLLQWRSAGVQKYDFWHRIFASYGVVTQQGYATLPMNRIGYGQEFNLGDKKTISWGLGRTSFPFDGSKSSYLTGYLNFEVRF
jgi:predicted Zn-dependent protease